MMAGTPALPWKIRAGHDEVIQAGFRSLQSTKSQTMPTTPPRPTVETPSKRPWHRLHLSTWVVILLLLGFFVIIEVPGTLRGVVWRQNEVEESFEHGWPCIFLDRKMTSETLGRLKNLTELDVSRTKLTDKSVPYLGQLSQLQNLDIFKTQISEEGYRQLKSMLPKCSIRYKEL